MTGRDWDTKLHWYRNAPDVYETHLDSRPAKVWAADGCHVAECEVDNPGGMGGFVTKAMFVRAGTEHSSDDTTNKAECRRKPCRIKGKRRRPPTRLGVSPMAGSGSW